MLQLPAFFMSYLYFSQGAGIDEWVHRARGEARPHMSVVSDENQPEAVILMKVWGGNLGL